MSEFDKFLKELELEMEATYHLATYQGPGAAYQASSTSKDDKVVS